MAKNARRSSLSTRRWPASAFVWR